MSSDFSNPATATQQQRFLEGALWRSMQPLAPVHINTAIHHEDQMLTWSAKHHRSNDVALSQYHAVALQQLRTNLQLMDWKFGDVSNVGPILDFASGFGRMIRMLVVSVPPSNIWVSDIQSDAVAFQQEQFGVHGIVSTTNPEEFEPGHTFNFISVASLFSHLPGETFNRWLVKLYSLLNPGGLLCFSVHDEVLMGPERALPESGIHYDPGSEIDTLDTSAYGTAHVSEACVQRSIQQASGSSAFIRIKRALAYQQDMYIVQKESAPLASPFRFEYGPWGWVDQAKVVQPGRIFIAGWAVTVDPDNSIQSVEVRLDGKLVQMCMPNIQRPDVRAHFGEGAFGVALSDGSATTRKAYDSAAFGGSGWECQFLYDAANPGQYLEVTAVSSSGWRCPLYLGAVEKVLF
jgi:SAM-dependent methyltransferase